MSIDVRIEINWNITLWNEMKLNKYQATINEAWSEKTTTYDDDDDLKSSQTHEKLYNNTQPPKMGCVRIFNYVKKRAVEVTRWWQRHDNDRTESTPRKTYKTELHAIGIEWIDVYVSKSIWLNAHYVLSITVSVHRFCLDGASHTHTV